MNRKSLENVRNGVGNEARSCYVAVLMSGATYLGGNVAK